MLKCYNIIIPEQTCGLSSFSPNINSVYILGESNSELEIGNRSRLSFDPAAATMDILKKDLDADIFPEKRREGLSPDVKLQPILDGAGI